MRDHDPVVIEEFNGLWIRGDREVTPRDHFVDCENIAFIESGFRTRSGVDVHQMGEDPEVFLPNVVRGYTFISNGEQGLLVLDTEGNLYHTLSPTPFTPILTIVGMTDFAFIQVATRAYISPHDGVMGLENEFLYVYLGDGTAARKAAGAGPTGGTFTAANSATAGNVEAGIHIFGVIYETDTGYRTQIGAVKSQVTAPGTQKIDLTNINVSPDSFVVARQIVATKAIDPTLFTGNLEGYEFFFVPDGRIADNVATTLTVNFYDSELLESASHLFDLFSEIPAGVLLTTYHDRLILGGEFGDIPGGEDEELAKPSTLRISEVGEPEAINQVTGLIVTPLEGNPLTNASEYRDVLYAFKKIRTYAYNDNGDDPSSWPITIIDQGIGASVHGIAQVLDSGGVDVEYLMVIDYSGIMIFNGVFPRPEFSYKILDFWFSLDRDDFIVMQMVNDTLNQCLYVNLPDGRVLMGDYSEGLTPKTVKWAIWSFDVKITGLTMMNVNQLILFATTPEDV